VRGYNSTQHCYCATTGAFDITGDNLSIGGRPVARNNRTRTTKSDDSNDFSRRRFIQGSVAAAAGILGLNPSSQAEAAEKSPENNGKDDFKGKRPNPGLSGTSGTSFISLFNNLGSNYSLTPGPILFQNENGAQGILQSSSDINLLTDNATINILTSGFYSIQYNATIELNAPCTGDEWFTAINVNGTDIKGPACKAPTTINQTTNLPFNGSLIVNVIAPSTIQLRVVVVDGTPWRIGPNVRGYGSASMTVVRIM